MMVERVWVCRELLVTGFLTPGTAAKIAPFLQRVSITQSVLLHGKNYSTTERIISCHMLVLNRLYFKMKVATVGKCHTP